MLKNYELLFFLSLVDSVLKYFIKASWNMLKEGQNQNVAFEFNK